MCAQLITNGTFTRVYPMESKASVHIAAALTEFIDDVGIPDTLVCDLASEQTGKHTEVIKIIRRMNIKTRMAEKEEGSHKTIELRTRFVRSRSSGKPECDPVKSHRVCGTMAWYTLQSFNLY
jgi:hypothetical protein